MRHGMRLLQGVFRGQHTRDLVQGQLLVRVVSGVKLRNRELLGKQNPYVVFTLTSGEAGAPVADWRSPTVFKGGRNPVWPAGVEGVLPFTMLASRCRPVTVNMVAWDEDRRSSHDRIGIGALDLSERLLSDQAADAPVRHDVPLLNSTGVKPCGTLVIETRVVLDPASLVTRRTQSTSFVVPTAPRPRRRCSLWGIDETRNSHGRAYVIQRAWALHKFRQDRSLAALALQAHFRRFAAANTFRVQRGAATTLQTAFRGHHQRRMFVSQRRAALMLGAAARRRSAQRDYLASRAAACTLQAGARGMLARVTLRQQQLAARLLQAAVRRHKARRQYLASRSSACLIQASFRGASARSEYQRQRLAALMFQTAFRRRSAMVHYHQQRQATVLLQAQFRSHSARAAFSKQRAAAVLFQAAWRRRSARSTYLQQRHAVVLLQSRVRANRACDAMFKRWLASRLLGRAAAHFLQRRTDAATRLQAAARRHVAQRRHAVARRGAIAMQCAVRCRLAETRMFQRWLAMRLLQRAANRFLQRRAQAATAIQAALRMRLAKMETAKRQAAAVMLQAAVRRHRARREYLGQRTSATLIQASIRGARARGEFLTARQAATLFACAWRRRQARLDYLDKRNASILLQAQFRRHTAQTLLARQRCAVTAVAAAWRRHRARSLFIRCRGATVAVQSAWRGCVARALLTRSKGAAVVLQRVWRCHMTRTRFLLAKTGMVRVQALHRGRTARSRFSASRRGVVRLQAAHRGRRCRRRWVGEVTVTVVQGLKLRSRELLGKQSPKVEIRMSPQQEVPGRRGEHVIAQGFTGVVHKGGRNPVWEAQHSPAVSLPFDVAAGSPLFVVLEAWDHEDRRANQRIGVSAPLNIAPYVVGQRLSARRSTGHMEVQLCNSTGMKECGQLVVEISVLRTGLPAARGADAGASAGAGAGAAAAP